MTDDAGKWRSDKWSGGTKSLYTSQEFRPTRIGISELENPRNVEIERSRQGLEGCYVDFAGAPCTALPQYCGFGYPVTLVRSVPVPMTHHRIHLTGFGRPVSRSLVPVPVPVPGCLWALL